MALAQQKQTQKKAARKPTKSAPVAFPSTALTSPLTEATSRRKPTSRRAEEIVDSRSFVRDDFVVSDDEDDQPSFEPVRGTRRREETPQLGGPITNDERMADLPDLHRGFIEQFVEEANKEMEKIRNSRGLKKAFFTEANLREMAINWTITLDDMEEIPNINTEAVKMWGKKFLPLIQQFSAGYEEAAMNDLDGDKDKNHLNVIDLCSEEEEDDDEYGMNESDEEAIMQAEQGSKYFINNASSSKKQGQSSRTLPRPSATSGASSYKPAPKKVYNRGGSSSFRGKGRRKFSGRRSASSTSGQSHAGAAKRKAPVPKTSAAEKKSSAAKGTADLRSALGDPGTGSGRGGGSGSGGSGGIRMMPT